MLVTNFVTTTNVVQTANFSTNMVISSNFSQVSLSNEIYIKYTIGFDKNFDGGWYLNCQYNHGFFNERGNTGDERLQDYLLVRLEKSFLSDKLKLGITGLGNVNNMYDAVSSTNFNAYISDNWGLLGQFSVSYMPSASLTLEIGVIGIDGKDSTTLGQMRNYDQVYTKLEYTF